MIDWTETKPESLVVGAFAQAMSDSGGSISGKVTAVTGNMIEVEGFPLNLETWIHWNVERPKKYLPITPGSVIHWWPDWEDTGDGHLIMLDENGNWGSAAYSPREQGINHYEVVHVMTQLPD